MDYLLKLEESDIGELPGGNNLDLRKKVGGMFLCMTDAILDTSGGDANLVQRIVTCNDLRLLRKTP